MTRLPVYFSIISCCFIANQSLAQRILSPSVPFLTITPDARAAAMGETGVATSADANALFWNPSRLAFSDKYVGASISYTPWLRHLNIPDMALYNASAYKKVAKDQVIGFNINYFDLGQFIATTNTGTVAGQFASRDFALSGSYARKLSKKLGMGISLRYINSNPAAGLAITGISLKPGTTVAGDIGVYYTNIRLDNRIDWSWGASITNLGGKISYGNEPNYIPTNLRFGISPTIKLNEYNKIVFALDFNKLMIPTPPLRDAQGKVIAGRETKDLTLFSGIFGSFSDAPDGFSEELQEITTSFGVEYWYNNVFALRAGYLGEAKNKGDRKHLTLGFGANVENFGLDFAYLLPMNQDSPLSNTLRFTLSYKMDKKREQTPEDANVE